MKNIFLVPGEKQEGEQKKKKNKNLPIWSLHS